MDVIGSMSESGHTTKVFQEKFSLRFDFPNFNIEETYEIDNDAAVRRKIMFRERNSESQVIGQSISFPSSWCVNIQRKDDHARVGLKFRKYLMGDGVNTGNYAIVKFRINFVDKDGDLVYERKWKSWELPRRIRVNQDFAMIDFIPLDHLFEQQDFLLPDKTLRVLCEGVLYSGFEHSLITTEKRSTFRMAIPTKDFLESSEFDVQLVGATEEKGHKAHKTILSDASHVLRGLVSAMKNDDHHDDGRGSGLPILQLEDLPDFEVSKMIEYIYTGDVKLGDWSDYQQVERLVKLARAYELRGLRHLCVNKILNEMTMAEFPKIAKFFHKNFEDQYVQEILHRYYLKHQETLMQRESFKKFAVEEKDAFLYVVLFSRKGKLMPGDY